MKLNIKKKHVTALALAGVMISSPMVALAAEYKDVPTSHWAYSHISKLGDLKVIQGYPDGNYLPERAVSYLEIMELLMGVMNPTASELTNAIRDKGYIADEYGVPEWAKDSVSLALSRNVITELNLKQAFKEGLVTSTPKENQFPSRQTIAVYYARALKLDPDKDHSVLKYKDLDKIGVVNDEKIGQINVADYLSALVKAGIFAAEGSDGSFEATRTLRRSEMAKITDLSYKYMAEKGNIENKEGKVVFVREVSGKKTVAFTMKDGVTKAAEVSDSTKISKNGKQVSFSDIKEGQEIVLKVVSNSSYSEYLAKEIEIVSSELKSTGKLTKNADGSVNIAYSTGNVDFNKFVAEKTEKFTLAKDLKAKVYGKEIALSNIKANDFVEFVAEDNVIKELNVIPQTTSVIGTIKYDTSNFSNNGYGKLLMTLEDGKTYEFNVKDYNLISTLIEASKNANKKYEIVLSYKDVSKIQEPQITESIVGFYEGGGYYANSNSIRVDGKDYPLANQVKFTPKNSMVSKNLDAKAVAGELYTANGAIVEIKLLNGYVNEISLRTDSLIEINTRGQVAAAEPTTIFNSNWTDATIVFDREVAGHSQVRIESPLNFTKDQRVTIKAYVNKENKIQKLFIDGNEVNFNR